MKEDILDLLADAFPTIDFCASDRMVEDGTLDSLTIVQVVGELSVEYDIEFSFEDLSEENFNSIDGIVALVERLAQ